MSCPEKCINFNYFRINFLLLDLNISLHWKLLELILHLRMFLISNLLLINIYFIYFTAVKVKLKSVKHRYPISGCDSGFMEIPADKINTELNITYSYSVKFEVCFKV